MIYLMNKMISLKLELKGKTSTVELYDVWFENYKERFPIFLDFIEYIEHKNLRYY